MEDQVASGLFILDGSARVRTNNGPIRLDELSGSGPQGEPLGDEAFQRHPVTALIGDEGNPARRGEVGGEGGFERFQRVDDAGRLQRQADLRAAG